MSVPHSKKLAADYSTFLDDLGTSVSGFISSARSEGEIASIHKIATACHTVFMAFTSLHRDLLLGAIAGLARRMAVLSVLRQVSLSRVELRRMIECAFWYFYFVDHPVEWEEFVRNPQRGWDERTETPIANAAGSGIGMFAAYARERAGKDPSGLSLAAADVLRTEYGNVSAEVHAAVGAVHPSGSLALAFDRFDLHNVAKLRETFRRIGSEAVILCAAVDPAVMSRLDAIDRAWFDWLVGSERAKIIRGAAFGISR